MTNERKHSMVYDFGGCTVSFEKAIFIRPERSSSFAQFVAKKAKSANSDLRQDTFLTLQKAIFEP